MAWPCSWTALLVACNVGNTDIVSRLVKVSGVDVNYQDADGYSALYCALSKGHSRIVKILGRLSIFTVLKIIGVSQVKLKRGTNIVFLGEISFNISIK